MAGYVGWELAKGASGEGDGVGVVRHRLGDGEEDVAEEVVGSWRLLEKESQVRWRLAETEEEERMKMGR